MFHTITIDWWVPSPGFLFEAERDAGVRTAALLSRQTRETLISIRLAIEKAVSGYSRGTGFLIPMAAHVVAAQKQRRSD
jgi:hypothetical protein